MKPVIKAALTLMATFALLLGQGASMTAGSPAPAKKMGCCGDVCPTHCCVERGDSAPTEPLPAIPAGSSIQQLQATLLPVIFQHIDFRMTASTVAPPLPGLSSAVSPVPLYVRTHSFLI